MTKKTDIIAPAKSTPNKSSIADIKTKIIIILPLSEQPIFPTQNQSLVMNELPWMESIKAVGEADKRAVGLFFVKEFDQEQVSIKDFPSIGTLVKMRPPALRNHKIQFAVEGTHRIKIIRWLSKKAPFRAEVEYLVDTMGGSKKSIQAHALSISKTLEDLIEVSPLFNEELQFAFSQFSLDDPAQLSDFAINLSNATVDEKQAILEQTSLKKRLTKTLTLLKKTLEIAKLQVKIQHETGDKMDQHQREYFLKEQLKTIQSELGINKNESNSDINKYTKRLAKLKLPESAKSIIDEEVNKLATLEIGSPDYSVVQHHLDWLTDLPWGIKTRDRLNLIAAKKSLDKQHFGWKKLKIEF